MAEDETGDDSGDDSEPKTRFQMSIEPETAEYLRDAYPDQMNVQERLRAAVSEVRMRRNLEGGEPINNGDSDGDD